VARQIDDLAQMGIRRPSRRRSLKWRAFSCVVTHPRGFVAARRQAKVKTRSAGSGVATIAPTDRYVLSSTPYIDFAHESNPIRGSRRATSAHVISPLALGDQQPRVQTTFIASCPEAWLCSLPTARRAHAASLQTTVRLRV
jgi:hypothetical protein